MANYVVLFLFVWMIIANASDDYHSHRMAHRRLQKKRELASKRKLDGSDPVLDMNCGSLSASDCLVYMQNYLNEYINVNKSYSKQNIPVRTPYNNLDPPVPGDVYDTINAEILNTMGDLLAVDIITGTMTVSMYIDLIWVDQLLNWDPNATQSNTELIIPTDMIWLPDILMYNAIGGYATKIDPIVIFLYSDGSVWYSIKLNVNVGCEFDLSKFPFDTQVCTSKFSSWAYPDYQLNISDVVVDVDPEFGNLAWEVESVSSSRYTVRLWEVYDYAFAAFPITIIRYSSHYVRTAMLPAILITCIVLCGLWIPDVGPRLSISVTGFLTNIAVQWSVSRQLPITNGSIWLSDFLNICMLFVAIVCAQCFTSGYISSRKESKAVPLWVKYLIRLSVLHHIDLERTDRHRKSTGNVGGDVALKSLSPDDSSAAGNEEGIDMKDVTSNTNNNNTNNTTTATTSSAKLHTMVEQEFSWKRGGRAFDRICKVLIPICYVIVISVKLAEVT